jgi:hypothetical protein
MSTPIYSLVRLSADKQARLAELRAFAARYDAAWKRHATFGRSGASSATKEQQAAIIAEAGDFTNELRAELEGLEFIANPPARYFAYPSPDKRHVTGFMGNSLATITALGRAWRSNMGDTRQTFRAVGHNGLRYFGTIYGTYCRLRVCVEATR